MNQYVCRVENVLRGEARERLVDARDLDTAYRKMLGWKFCREMVKFGNDLSLDGSPCPFTFSVRQI